MTHPFAHLLKINYFSNRRRDCLAHLGPMIRTQRGQTSPARHERDLAERLGDGLGAKTWTAGQDVRRDL